jgi:hypothetical protein
MSQDSIFKKLRSFLNPAIKGKFTNAMLEAIAAGDALNEANILAIKDQMFIVTATGEYLSKLFAGVGVQKPTGTGISDDLFRKLGITITKSKLVTNVFLDVLEIFYGADSIRANVLSSSPQGYFLKDQMSLIIKVDNNPNPLVVTFTASDFTNIANATAEEVANVISRASFDAGYTLTASAYVSASTQQTYVQLMSGTKGPKSSITVVGGSAQNVLNFPARSLTSARYAVGNATEFTTSFVGKYVRFTWSGGLNPSLGFLNIGDYVNIYGNQVYDSNKGSFLIEEVQDGPVGQAYFDIINPNFTLQNITVNDVGASSGSGTATTTVSIINEGLVRSSNVVTVTTSSPHGFSAGQIVTIAGASDNTFNSSLQIISILSSTQFTVNQLGADAVAGFGTASVSYSIQVAAGAVRSSGISTITTTTTHNLLPGHLIVIQNVNDSSFDGTFNIVGVTSNTFTYVQDTSNDIAFFTPIKQQIQEMPRYASVYEVNPYEVVIFLPATTSIVKRDLKGAWHVHNLSTDKDFVSAYCYNPKTGLSISSTNTTLTSDIYQSSSQTVGFGFNTSDFPDQEGYVVFEFGTSNQEGPVKYFGRPSSKSLLLDPSYKFKKTHLAGANMSLVSRLAPYKPVGTGADYPTYLTGTARGRIEAQSLIEQLAAAGIFLNIVIVYPKGPGLEDITEVYGGDLL